MTNGTPYIPEDAPFNADQRAWLNGFLAGIFSSAPTETASSPALSLDVTAYFATQSGTAERLAKKFAKELKSLGHAANVRGLGETTPEQLSQQSHAVFFVSTYGDGEPPEQARAFRDSLQQVSSPMLGNLHYSVFALGDSNYENFCAFGKELDERLAALGATRIADRTDSDVDVDEPFTAWKSDCLAALRSTGSKKEQHSIKAPTPAVAAVAAAPRYSREKPWHAEIMDRHSLIQGDSGKQIIHLALRLDEGLSYEAGDACGVLAQNDPDLVDEILSLVPIGADEPVQVPKAGSCTAREALLHHYQHTRLTRKMVQSFAELTGCKVLASILPADQSAHLDAYMHDRGLIDLLHEYPGAITSAQQMFSILPHLAPRLYSISSSPAKHGTELHCTIGVVRYRSHNRDRGGVASTMLAERVKVGAAVPMYIHPNKKFRLPADGDTPIIMIGPGTGIAPFRGFLHEREARGQKGPNWLFFGERSARSGFLYCQELREMSENGHLTRLDTAFSRDQAHKIYVQDRMLEQGAELWRWLEDGARVYVCGDASRMAKDVDAALCAVIAEHGSMDAEIAREYIAQMHEQGRYLRDVY